MLLIIVKFISPWQQLFKFCHFAWQKLNEISKKVIDLISNGFAQPTSDKTSINMHLLLDSRKQHLFNRLCLFTCAQNHPTQV